MTPANDTDLAEIRESAGLDLIGQGSMLRKFLQRIPLLGFLALAALAAAAAGLLSNRLYWGYWIEPPVIREVEQLDRIEAFTARWPKGAVGKQPLSGRSALTVAASFGAQHDPSFPLGRLPLRLAQRGLAPESDERLPELLLQEGLRLLDLEGVLVEGKAGNAPWNSFDAAYFVTGRTRAGERLLLVATDGGQVSNDHYSYYEAAFSIDDSESLHLLNWQRFYYDVAGLEENVIPEFPTIIAGVVFFFVAYGVHLSLHDYAKR